jgi:phage baseplate assembly protein V
MTLLELQNRIYNMNARSVVRLVNDTSARQQLQIEVTQGEVCDPVEHPQNYGFTSHPLPGSDGFVFFIGGMREQGVVLVVDDRRYRVHSTEPGEVGVYDDLGNKIFLRREQIEVVAVTHVQVNAPTVAIDGATSIDLTAPTVNITADNVNIEGEINLIGPVNVTGDVDITGGGTINGKSFDENHQHSGGTIDGHTGGIL